jgi:heat shock protein HtpX
MKRILLLVATNFAVLAVLSVSMQLLGIDRMLAQDTGLNLQGLLMMAALFGFGGSFISLLISKWMAKRATGAHVIEVPANMSERWLVDTVKRQAEKAGIGMPEVAIYDAPEINAFATGWNKNSALVAVSTGLLQNMTQEEAEAVLGHEVSHVANGDMVTLTLIQGVLNTFVIFLSRVVGYVVDRVVFKNDRGHGPGFWVTTIVAQLVLGILASIVVMWFSRFREFRADAGGAALAGRNKMIAALERLKLNHEQPAQLPDAVKAFGISGGVGGGLKRLFMSHPPLDERIAALREAGAPQRVAPVRRA